MLRLFTCLVLSTTLLVGCDSASSDDKSQPSSSEKKTNKIEDNEPVVTLETSNTASEEIATEKVLLEQDSLFVYEKLAELNQNVTTYCNCMEKATSNSDCKSEYAKLNFELDEELNNRLPHEFKKNIMRKASELIIESQQCDKDL